MTIQVLKKEEAKVDAGQETSKFILNAAITLTCLIGLWAVVCFIGGLASSGVGALVKGYISTITG